MPTPQFCAAISLPSMMHFRVNHRIYLLVLSAHAGHKVNAKCRLLSRLSSSVIIHTVKGGFGTGVLFFILNIIPSK
jgi:hypothetical protein